MFVADPVRLRVEISEIAARDIDRANTKAHLASIDTIEIDQLLECRPQWRIIVIARFVRTPWSPHGRRRHARHKEIRRAQQEGAHGVHLVYKLVLDVVVLDMQIGYAEWRSGRLRAKIRAARQRDASGDCRR